MASRLTQIGVPKPFRGTFVALVSLEDGEFNVVLDALRSTPPFSPVEALRRTIREALPEHDAALDTLVPALLSLRGQLRGTPTPLVAESASQTLDLDLDSDTRARLSARLVPLLDNRAVTTTANALELLTQNQRNFQSARVFTDVRPVFEEDAKAQPTGAVIIETLQINTWDRDGASDTIYVALDETDLRDLKEAVDRALEKTQTVRQSLANQEITYFELDEGAS